MAILLADREELTLEILYVRFMKCFLLMRRCLDPKNIPKTPFQEVFGSLGIPSLCLFRLGQQW